VPLGLVKRETKERPQLDRDFDPSADRGSEFYRIETTPIEHDDFLQTVIDRQPGEHIVILGEPGAGKTTLLTRVWQSLLEQMNSESLMIVAWVPLAALTNQGLAGYLEDVWLHKFCGDNKSSYWESFKELAAAGRVYLLLDGADEMGGDGLTKIQGILEQPWKNLRVVITCRLNLWDGGSQNVLKEQFKIFRTLDFSYDNPDRVQQFIDKWFEGAEAGRNLRSALDEVGKERIKDLAQNPLRLTLLCNIWQKSGGLPDTQAGLYEQFVNFVYGWSKVLDARELQLELDRAMGQLAKYGINKPVLRFRFTERELQAQVPNIEHRKALKALGWLNCVGEDREGNEVYAFFHPTFQEYFAACSIDDWDYFLPRAHVDRPLPCLGEEEIGPTYRVFESEWRQPIVLWFGRGDVADEDKEKFIEKLTTFQDGVGDFYYYRAYCMAAIGVGEVKYSKLAEAIVQQIVRWAFIDDLPSKTLAKETFQLTHQGYAINTLVQLLKQFDFRYSSYLSHNGFQELCRVCVGNEEAIDALIKLLRRPELEPNLRSEAAKALGQIAVGNEKAIDTLLKLLREPELENILYYNAAKALGQINVGNEEAIGALIKLLREPKLEPNLRSEAAKAFSQIAVGNEKAIDTLIKLLREPELEPNFRSEAAKALSQIAVNNDQAVDFLLSLFCNSDCVYSFRDDILGQVGREKVVNAITQHLQQSELKHEDILTLVEFVDIGNQEVINALEKLLDHPDDLFSSNAELGLVLIDVNRCRQVLEVLVELTKNPELESWIHLFLRLLINWIVEHHQFHLDRLVDLSQICVNNEQAIKMLRKNDPWCFLRSSIKKVLNKICIGNEQAGFTIIKILERLSLEYNQIDMVTALNLSNIEDNQITSFLIRLAGNPLLDYINDLVDVLEKIGIDNTQAIDKLLQLLGHPDLENDYQILNTLEKIGVGNTQAINGLLQLLGRPDLKNIYQIFNTLEKIGVGNTQAINGLLQLLGHPELKSKYWVLVSLEKIGVGNTQTINGLLQLLGHPELKSKYQIFNTLEKIGVGNAKVINELLQFLYRLDDFYLCMDLEQALCAILTEKTMPPIIWQLTYHYQSLVHSQGYMLKHTLSNILFHCVQSLSYQKFYGSLCSDSPSNFSSLS
jgi:NACHT domain/HEAT repeats/PBS lyase HEAT-like repeat